jgi:acyl-CoA thioester hydrolase
MASRYKTRMISEIKLSQWPTQLEIPVAWGDMDSFRHVNNAVYVRWFESARIDYFLKIGIVNTDGVGPILARISVNYRRPVIYPDTIRVETTVTQFGRTSFSMSYRAISKQQGGELVADSDCVIVMFDYQRQEKVPLSDELKQKILALESSTPLF